MDGLFALLSLSLVMAVASFLAGLLPISFSLSPSQLRLISALGMGLLVGTSLIVIIPEGVETLYSATALSQNQHHAVNARELEPVRPAARSVDTWGAVDGFPGGRPLAESSDSIVSELVRTRKVDQVQSSHADGPKDQTSTKESPHAWIGLSLIAGFILMFLIDKLPHHATPNPTTQPYHISLNDLGRASRTGFGSESHAHHEGLLQGNDEGSERGSRGFATTTGLVIHASADGIALGASSSAGNDELSFIIFLAIMVHKAPAAFGLASLLLKQGLSKRAVKAHLLLFSLAAPAGAILTWLFAHSIGAGLLGNAKNTQWWTAVLLLFSGGTFLYVAMHTMCENNGRKGMKTNGSVDINGEGRDASKEPQHGRALDLLVAVVGMILPLFLQIGHAH